MLKRMKLRLAPQNDTLHVILSEAKDLTGIEGSCEAKDLE